VNLALVTGASSGLGRELCLLLAKKGVRIIASARNFEKLRELALELPESTLLHPADLSDPASRKTLIALIRQMAPDVLINSAGFGLYGDILSHSIEEELKMIHVNLEAAIELSVEAAKSLKEKKKEGVILNVSSAAAAFIYPSFALYAATKAALLHFSQSFDTEMRPFGIRILTALPGKFDSDFRLKAGGKRKKKEAFCMPTRTVAQAILEQIQKKQKVRIIDLRYKLLLFVGRHLLPQWFVEKILRSAIQ